MNKKVSAKMKKILFTTPVLEYPSAGGPQLRIKNSIKALNKVSELYVLSRLNRLSIGGLKAEKFYKNISHYFNYLPGCKENAIERLLNYRVKINNKYIRYLVNLPLKILSRIFRVLLIKKREGDISFIINFVKNKNIDIIWFGYGNTSYELMKGLKNNLPGVKMVCDTDSVWSRFILRELEMVKDPERHKRIEAKGRKKEEEEKQWVKFCDITTAVSEVDAEYYRSIANDHDRIKIFSNVIDVDNYKNIPPPPSGFKKPCIYLAGSFWPKSSMDQAARWVINKILPIVKKQIPDIYFYIVGRNSKETLNDINDQSISITGKLPSVLPYLCNSDVSIVPLWFESGTRFKILEAGACKIPVVSTTLGAEGLPVINRKDILIADNPDEFANAVVRLIRNRKVADRLAENLNRLVQSKFNIESLVKEAQNILDYLEASKSIS